MYLRECIKEIEYFKVEEVLLCYILRLRKYYYEEFFLLLLLQDSLPLPDQIDEATKYIKKLEENVMNLKEKKDSLVGVDGKYSNIRGYSLNSPVQIEVHEKGSAVEVILVTGLECQFVFTEAMRIVHEEHAEVVNASYSVVGTTVFHSIHAKVNQYSHYFFFIFLF